MNRETRLATTLLLATAAAPALGAQAVWDTALGPGSGSGAPGSPWIAAPLPAGASYAEWNVFDVYPTDSSPDLAGTGTVTETTGLAFIPGSGNIYSFSGPTAFTLELPGGGSGMREVWLRIGTLGTLLNATATLNGFPASAIETFTEAFSGGGFDGHEKEWYWRWTVPAAAFYNFTFGAVESSLSLDQLAVYAAPVEPVAVPMPLPALALLGAGLALVGGRRARWSGATHRSDHGGPGSAWSVAWMLATSPPRARPDRCPRTPSLVAWRLASR